MTRTTSEKETNATAKKKGPAAPSGQRGQAAGQRVGGGDDRGARAPEKNVPEASGRRKHAR